MCSKRCREGAGVQILQRIMQGTEEFYLQMHLSEQTTQKGCMEVGGSIALHEAEQSSKVASLDWAPSICCFIQRLAIVEAHQCSHFHGAHPSSCGCVCKHKRL